MSLDLFIVYNLVPWEYDEEKDKDKMWTFYGIKPVNEWSSFTTDIQMTYVVGVDQIG